MDALCIESMNLHCTDALPSRQIQVIERTKHETLSARHLQRAEEDLEQFEKVSILFLIAADYPGTYEKVLRLLENFEDKPNIIAEFVENNFDLWGNKLFEALCVINNQEILKNLGFDPSAVATKYLQNTSRYTVHIHIVSKVLYQLFETMNHRTAKLFLGYVKADDHIENMFNDDHYLELHALYWLHTKYITIAPDGRGDLSKLRKHLKRLDYGSQRIYEDVEHFSKAVSQSDSCSMEKYTSNDYLEYSEKNNGSTRRNIADTYKIKKGKCVIINEENFSSTNQYEKREGTKKDSHDLRRTFMGMGFDVEDHTDLTEVGIMVELRKVAESFDKKIHDCLVVAILSHGYDGGIISSDGIEIPIKVIDNAVCSDPLREVVKILIIQACQGKLTGDVSEKSGLALDGPNSENIRSQGHFARFMSTMKGFNSIRHRGKGSWFIQAVCEVLSSGKSISVAQWSAGVIKIVRSQEGSVNECQRASQIPELHSRLETEVYFPPYKENGVIQKEIK